MQKGGFCNVKVWFLHAKNHTFAAQKGGFLQSIVIQIVTQYCFSHILFPIVSIAIRNILQITTNCFC